MNAWQQNIGRPVGTGNASAMRAMLRLTHVRRELPGAGRLFNL
jgi:maleate cis-trans isomerase